MEQLPLEVRLADYALFDTYYAGPNAEPVHALEDLVRDADDGVVWLWGPAETGKTHLLQACINSADGRGLRSAYLPLGSDFGLTPEVVEGMSSLDLVCIDDVGKVAGDTQWEQALFRLFESLRQDGGRLVFAALQSPLNCSFELPDLVSRFSSGATFRLRALSDDDKLRAFHVRADWRGLSLPDETARYLMTRVDRGLSPLFSLLDQLDRAALTAQRKLTVPFVKDLLGGHGD
jgi:DnaA family protein